MLPNNRYVWQRVLSVCQELRREHPLFECVKDLEIMTFAALEIMKVARRGVKDILVWAYRSDNL